MTALHQAGRPGLVCPTVADLRAAVLRVSRGDERLWPLLCIAAGVAADADDLASLEALIAIASERTGAVKLAAMSVSIRLGTYRALSMLKAGRVAADSGECLMTDYVTDVDRLDVVATLDLFSDSARTTLDAYAERAAVQFDAPVALVSIILDSAQYIAGGYGLKSWVADVRGAPVEWSFCAQVVRSRSAYVVHDAVRDPRTEHRPGVVFVGIGSYAGVPLVSSTGHVLGAHRIVDSEARAFTARDVGELQRIADELVQVLEGPSALPV